MKKLILNAWLFIANKIGLNDMNTQDVIMVEIVRRQNMMIREIESSRTMIDLIHCKMCIESYLLREFDYSLITNTISILNSHMAWKKLEFKQREPKPQTDVITERPLNDDEHD